MNLTDPIWPPLELPETLHTCHAIGCDVPVPPRLRMCQKHWRMVPPELRRRVWSTCRPGQEITKDPSLEYGVAARAAIEAVRLSEPRTWRRTERRG